MANDAAFRTAVVWLGGVVLMTGLYTHFSFKKMVVTYMLGMCGICGVLLPDWEFFDRPFSQWVSPLTFNHNNNHNHSAAGSQSHQYSAHIQPTRFRIYPIRLVAYTVVYGFAFYEWWVFISSN